MGWVISVGLLSALTLSVLFALAVVLIYGRLWIESYSCGAQVSMRDLVVMSLRGVNPRTIVTAKIMGKQSGISIDDATGMSNSRLQSHALAGGDVLNVVLATIAAKYAGLPLGFDRAMSIDLAGRDLADSVRTTVLPKVIHCPDMTESGQESISGVSKDGIELFVRAWVTVRTNLDQVIGGATEKTIIARVGQGIISAIGSTDSFKTVLETPSIISKKVLERGLDANTSFAIVSIDIVNVSVGTNIGATLMIAQAEADMKTAKAEAESRLAMAIALEQEMTALITKRRAEVIHAESLVPHALASAYTQGHFQSTANANADSMRNFPHICDGTSIGA
jgi:uncharacterized protein YqfA (UPF0365 family)